MTQRPCVGLLYPTPNSGEDDFVDVAAQLDPAPGIEVIYMPWPEDVDDLAALDVEQAIDALRRLGSTDHLERVLPPAVDGTRATALVFAVTSSSFVHGADGVERQSAAVSHATGRPATSTTAAFQQAIRHLKLHKVALASVYHPRLSDHFIERIREAGAEVVHRVDAAARSDRELAAWPAERIVDLVRDAAHPEAQAVLLPETALHAGRSTAELEDAAGCPVLTATQVSLWAGMRLAGVSGSATTAGPLFLG